MTSDAWVVAAFLTVFVMVAFTMCLLIWRVTVQRPHVTLTRDELLGRELERLHDLINNCEWKDMNAITIMQEAVLKRMDKPEGKADE